MTMGVLTANLKSYYQCRSLWFFYAVGLFFLFPIINLIVNRGNPGRGYYVLFLVVGFLAGQVTAGMQKSLLSKPVTYCLPRHREVPRRIVFLIGVVVNAALCPIILACPRLPNASEAFAAAFMAGMSAYFLGVWSAFGVDRSVAIVGFLLPGIMLLAGLGFGAWVEHTIIFHPLYLVGIGGLICLLSWNRLGRPDLGRRYFGRIGLEITDLFNWDKARRYGWSRTSRSVWGDAGSRVNRWDSLFLGRMAAHEPFSVGRFVWGALYSALGFVGTGLAGFLLVVIILGGVGAFMPMGKMGVAMLLNPIAVLGVVVPFPWERSMLLPGGRRDRFWGTMALVLSYTLLGTLALGIAEGAWRGLAAVLPQVGWGGRIYELHSPATVFFPLALFLLPLGFGFQGLVRNRSLLFGLLAIVILVGMFGATVLLEAGPAAVAGAIAAAWAFVAAVCYHHFSRRDLMVMGPCR
jgi:hypothetical protein